MTSQLIDPDLRAFARIAERRLDGAPLAVMLDVDGTLAPIAPTPAEAAVPDVTRAALGNLVGLPAAFVVLVSGRSAEDAWRLAGVDGAWVIGNHGLEQRLPDGSVHVAAEAVAFESAVAKAAGQLAHLETAFPGTLVENKRWSISVHHRAAGASDVPRVIEAARRAAVENGLRLTAGKRVAELRPAIAIDKGSACVELAMRLGALERSGSVLYAGDDGTDEDAFRRLRERWPRAVTIHIRGLPGEHLDSPTRAEITLESPAALQAGLEWILARRITAQH